jgi:hypothetical protein
MDKHYLTDPDGIFAQEKAILEHVGKALLKPGYWWWSEAIHGHIPHYWELRLRANGRWYKGRVHNHKVYARVSFQAMTLDFFVKERREPAPHCVRGNHDTISRNGVFVLASLDLTDPESLKHKTLRAALKKAQTTKPDLT